MMLKQMSILTPMLSQLIFLSYLSSNQLPHCFSDTQEGQGPLLIFIL
jgi:hypothetical protein